MFFLQKYEKEKKFIRFEKKVNARIYIYVFVSENLSVEATNLGSAQTLHADETGTITLPQYPGDQTLTPVEP